MIVAMKYEMKNTPTIIFCLFQIDETMGQLLHAGKFLFDYFWRVLGIFNFIYIIVTKQTYDCYLNS